MSHILEPGDSPDTVAFNAINPIALRFRDLAVGDTFDFVDDRRPGYNSFFERVRKISRRQYVLASIDAAAYRYSTTDLYTVGSINARVFHVEKAPPPVTYTTDFWPGQAVWTGNEALSTEWHFRSGEVVGRYRDGGQPEYQVVWSDGRQDLIHERFLLASPPVQCGDLDCVGREGKWAGYYWVAGAARCQACQDDLAARAQGISAPDHAPWCAGGQAGWACDCGQAQGGLVWRQSGTPTGWYTQPLTYSIEALPNGKYRLFSFGSKMSWLHASADAAKRHAAELAAR